MRAALQLVADDGLAATTTARIAEMAEVAEGTIYRHFSTKDELLIAVYRQIKRDVFEQVTDAYEPAANITERFVHLWHQTFLAYRADPQKLIFVQKFSETELVRTEGGLAHKPMAELLGALHRDGIHAGQFKSLPIDLMTGLFYAPIISILRAEQSGPPCPDTQIKTAMAAAFDAWRICPPIQETQIMEKNDAN